MIQRLRDTADERRVLLRLTAAGRALRKRAAGIPVAIGTAVGCSAAEAQRLTARVHRLRQQIDSCSTPAASTARP